MTDMDVHVFCARCANGEEHAAAWRLLSVALEQVFGEETLPAVAYGKKGKPYFPDREGIHFNLSHSYGAVACAVHDQPVGVDIEKLRMPPRRLAAGQDERIFFRLWTAKEACAKREGSGVAAIIGGLQPDSMCVTNEELLPGWILTVAPTCASKICFAEPLDLE